MEKQNNHIDRRGFLKIVGISAATTTAALYGCGSGTKSSHVTECLLSCSDRPDDLPLSRRNQR